MNELVYWIWLSMACTPGTVTFKKLIDVFPDPTSIFNANEDEIISVLGSKSRDVSALCDKDISEAVRIYEFCTTKGVGILTYSDPEFPATLRTIKEPPVMLYYRGKLPDFNRKNLITVVGTRRLSDYGRKYAFDISYDLASAGAVIVSGMALGIDGVATAAAISASGQTVAFLGSGINVCYPPEHRKLATEIVKNGCVFTEFHPGAKPDRTHFPIRNRLISGISAATVVIEGRERSGALLTARHAKAQNRPIYALPGSLDNRNSDLTNALIKDGARPIFSADDIINDFDKTRPGALNPFGLLDRKRPELFLVLTAMGVSALTPSDPVFKHGSRERVQPRPEPTYTEAAPREEAPRPDTSALQNFDKTAVKVYQMIPMGKDIAIEDLTSDVLSMREVMRALLSLEMGHFVSFVPGERVKRNF